MNYSDYFLSNEEFTIYQKTGKLPVKLKEIWEDLIERMREEMKKEAQDKGFVLVDNPDLEDDVIATYMMIQVPQASDELQKHLEDDLYPFVVCMKE